MKNIGKIFGGILITFVLIMVGGVASIAAVKSKALAAVEEYMWLTNFTLTLLVMMIGFHICNFANKLINYCELTAVKTMAVFFFLIIEYEIVFLYFLT